MVVRYYIPPELREKRNKLIEEASKKYSTVWEPNPLKVSCLFCKNRFRKKKNTTNKWRKQGYCSYKCLSKASGDHKEHKPKPKVKEFKKRICFYETREWQELRYKILKKYGRKCMVCFRTNIELHVDHIKPISKFPELKLEESNLQVLCRDCNLGKGNKDTIDWRNKE